MSLIVLLHVVVEINHFLPSYCRSIIVLFWLKLDYFYSAEGGHAVKEENKGYCITLSLPAFLGALPLMSTVIA